MEPERYIEGRMNQEGEYRNLMQEKEQIIEKKNLEIISLTEKVEKRDRWIKTKDQIIQKKWQDAKEWQQKIKNKD